MSTEGRLCALCAGTINLKQGVVSVRPFSSPASLMAPASGPLITPEQQTLSGEAANGSAPLNAAASSTTHLHLGLLVYEWTGFVLYPEDYLTLLWCSARMIGFISALGGLDDTV